MHRKKLVLGDVAEIDVPPPEVATPEPQNIPLDILFEDEDMLVINKPAGMVVHPGGMEKFVTHRQQPRGCEEETRYLAWIFR